MGEHGSRSASRSRAAPRSWGRRLLVVAGTLVAAFAAAEILLRLFHPVAHLAPIEEQFLGAGSALVHRPSSIPGLDYELAPGTRETYLDLPIEVNSLGLRGPEIPLAKPEGTFRVAALGDSLTFGYGILAGEAWPAALERALNEDPAQLGARAVEVLNFGVSGYNVADEVLVLRHKALAFEPDVVVVGYFLNDAQTAPLQPLQRYFHEPRLWERSHVLRLIDGWRFARGKARFGLDGHLYHHAAGGAGWRMVTRSFDEMHAIGAEQGVPVLVATLPGFAPFPDWAAYRWSDLHARILAAARASGLETLDLVPAFQESGRAPKELSIDSEHPNAAGQEIVARAIAGEIRRIVTQRGH